MKPPPFRKQQQQAAACAHGPVFVLSILSAVQASIGAGLSWTGRGDVPLSILSTARSWTDDRAWIADVVRAEPGDPRLALLFSWVIAAGGWISGTTAELPVLPAGLARLELHRILKQFGIGVCEVAVRYGEDIPR